MGKINRRSNRAAALKMAELALMLLIAGLIYAFLTVVL
jgi:hypothetical protein